MPARTSQTNPKPKTRATAVSRAGKSARLQLRLTPQADLLIREAAAAAHKDVSAFVLDAATRASADVLADRRTFVVGDEAWGRFVAALDRPVSPRLREEKPVLARLLSKTTRRD